MFSRQSILFREIQQRGMLRASDVARLQREYFVDGGCDEAGALALLALHAACPVQDMAWAPFFTRTVAGYLVHIAQPSGYLTAAKARWLIGHTSTGGRVGSRAGLDLVLAVLDDSRWSPPSLSAFALRQIELAIVTGQGPLTTTLSLTKGRVGAGEVALIRQILAAGDRDTGAMTQAEAEVLFDIHEATAAQANSSAWTELLTRTIANLIMTASGYAAPPRALDFADSEAAVLKTTADTERTKIGQPELETPPETWQRADGFRDVLKVYAARTPEEQALARLAHQRFEIITAEQIAVLEPSWLAARIGRPQTLTPPARALLAHLRSQPVVVHPALQPLLDAAA